PVRVGGNFLSVMLLLLVCVKISQILKKDRFWRSWEPFWILTLLGWLTLLPTVAAFTKNGEPRYYYLGFLASMTFLGVSLLKTSLRRVVLAVCIFSWVVQLGFFYSRLAGRLTGTFWLDSIQLYRPEYLWFNNQFEFMEPYPTQDPVAPVVAALIQASP